MQYPIPAPESITLRRSHRTLHLCFSDGLAVALPYEYLRVYSPSAEVRGHGLSEPILVRDKEQVSIIRIEPIGHYAIKLIFDDGHQTGIYTWEILYDLAKHFDSYWQRYQERLKMAGRFSDADKF
ncbi:MAG: DUF971 domain-containing protein [Coxiellaceae bacterium]|nr:MAG: DUF971 domain-containing protein [Coxiellaceae bacterium]